MSRYSKLVLRLSLLVGMLALLAFPPFTRAGSNLCGSHCAQVYKNCLAACNGDPSCKNVCIQNLNECETACGF
jgi:hypothetical protein